MVSGTIDEWVTECCMSDGYGILRITSSGFLIKSECSNRLEHVVFMNYSYIQKLYNSNICSLACDVNPTEMRNTYKNVDLCKNNMYLHFEGFIIGIKVMNDTSMK